MSLPILRTSERRDFGWCQWRWWQSWREGRKTIGEPPLALWFGSLVHDALAAYYIPGKKRGPHPAETFERLAGNEISFMKMELAGEFGAVEVDWVDAKALGISMLNGYVQRWSEEDNEWEIIQAERTFQLDVPHPSKPKLIGVFAGTYDLVKRHRATGEVWLGEHKTAKAIITGHLPLDPQAGGYLAVASQEMQHAGLLKRGQRIQGIEYNFLRKAQPDGRPRNADGYCTNKPLKAHYIAALGYGPTTVGMDWSLEKLAETARLHGITVYGEPSKNQPKPLFEREKVYRTPTESAQQLRRLQLELLAMKPIRDGKVEPLKSPNRDCHWCPHFGLCLLDEQGGDVDSYIDAAYIIRDPYADHRKTTEGDD